ncbi:MAG TPA: 7-cyano-7-deazaguanine synthase, partial [Chloroflexota bacterium]|nr:7-cyano-7-deazaguanine synthase [Chloroflexota bacterium]
RRHRHSGFRRFPTWSRCLRVRLGVRDRTFWTRPALAELLSEFLTWLTDDTWSIDFVERAAQPRASEMQLPLPWSSSPPASRVALLSGGADSLAGAVHLLQQARHQLVLVSASSNLRLGSVQRALVKALRRSTSKLLWIRVPFALSSRIGGRGRERSQRTRGFVFLALGGAAAALVGVDSLYVFENGIGAINLPYLEVQLDAQSSRTIHPLTQHYGGQLISAILGRKFEVRNPFLFKTKSEIYATVPDAFARLLGRTESCDNFAQRVAGRPRCGRCTSCVLRAQAFMASGRSEFERWGDYLQHPFAHPISPALAISLIQVDVIQRCLIQADPWLSLCQSFPALVDVPRAIWGEHNDLLRRSAQIQVVDLLRRYGAEWSTIGYNAPDFPNSEMDW